MKICALIVLLVIVLGAAGFWDKKIFIFLLSASLFCFAAAILSETAAFDEQVTVLDKAEAGGGAVEKQLTAKTDKDEVEISVRVPEREYTSKEALSILEKEKKLLGSRVLGENKSFNRIEKDMELVTRGTDTDVSVQWFSSDNEVISSEGKIGSSISQKGIEVTLKAYLELQEEEVVYEQKITVYPKALSGNLKEDLEEKLAAENADTTKKEYYLPDSINGKTVKWYEAKDDSYGYVCTLILIAGIFLKISRKQKETEKQKMRLQALKRDYPELVSRLLMMLYAGSSVRNAFFIIGSAYRKRKENDPKTDRNEALEEVLILCNEMENGVTQSEAYENMAQRCVLPCYRTLGVSLVQNQKRGSSHVLEALEQEILSAFGEKKQQARIAGDAASLKLILPLGLMLMIVFALMLVPAFLSL